MTRKMLTDKAVKLNWICDDEEGKIQRSKRPTFHGETKCGSSGGVLEKERVKEYAREEDQEEIKKNRRVLGGMSNQQTSGA